jgi:hypothetical protein
MQQGKSRKDDLKDDLKEIKTTLNFVCENQRVLYDTISELGEKLHSKIEYLFEEKGKKLGCNSYGDVDDEDDDKVMLSLSCCCCC